jgi:hypothetical protein
MVKNMSILTNSNNNSAASGTGFLNLKIVNGVVDSTSERTAVGEWHE